MTDATGAVIVGAEVSIRNVATDLKRSVQTGDDGRFVVPFLPLGTYEVSAQQTGFRKVVRSGIVLQVGQVAVIDIELPVGSATETVTVAGAAPLVDTATQQLGAVIDRTRVLDLPLNGRNFVQLITLVPGTTTGRSGEPASGTTAISFRGTSAFSANGFRSVSNNYLFDGVDNNQTDGVTSFSLEPVIDGIQEFRVLTANQPAEYGGFLGGVVNVQSKSGTNAFHGSAFEFLRNSALDAKNYFDDPQAKIPAFRQNQFGGSFGGPIKKGSTFFFGDFQGLRVAQGQTFLTTVPTQAMRNGDFSGLATIYDPLTTVFDPVSNSYIRTPFDNNIIPQTRIDPAAAKILQYIPLPNRPGLANNFLNNPTLRRSDNAFDIRIDRAFGGKDNFFTRYSYEKAVTYRPSPLSTPSNPFGGVSPVAFAGNFDLLAQNVAINETHVFTPHLLNEFRFGYNRFAINALPEGYGVNPSIASGIPNLDLTPDIRNFPSISISGVASPGPSAALPILSHQNTFQVVDNVSYYRGKHEFKFGANLIWHQRNFFDDAYPAGIFQFTEATTSVPLGSGGNGFASFLLGYPLATVRTNLIGPWGTRNLNLGLFFQDSYRIRPRLMLNLGLRYEIFTPWVEAYDRQSSFDLETGKMVLAGSENKYGRGLTTTDYNNVAPRIGLSYSLTSDSKTVLRAGYSVSYFQEYTGLNSYLTFNYPFVIQQQIVGNILTVGPKLENGPPALPARDPNQPSGTVRRLNPNNAIAYGQQYNLSIQREITPNLMLEVGYLGSRGIHLLELPDINQAVPGSGAINPRRPYYTVNPNIGSVLYLTDSAKSNYNALAVKAEKRTSVGLTFLLSYTWAKAMQQGEGSAAGSYGEQPLDPRDPLKSRGLASFDRKQVFIFSWNYQLPFSSDHRLLQQIVGGWAINGILTLESGPPFPITITPSLLNTGTFNRPDRTCDGSLPSSQRGPNRWFDTSCFVQPPAFQYGNTSMNALRAPGEGNLDLSIFKDFTLRENYTLQFRTEVFNFSNTPHFNLPNGAIGTPAAGTISSAGPSRQIQFALKLLF